MRTTWRRVTRKRRATAALARDADPIVVGQLFNRGSPVILVTVAN
jgi:hypothetical protein